MNDDLMGFEMILTDEEVKLLYYAVQEALRVWPGSPARPAEEQEQLRQMREDLFRMVLEMTWEKRSEDDSPR